MTQANLKETVCRKGGYTSSVRPPASLTDPAKIKIMAAYGIPASDASKYELDHLEPLAIGGASDVRNLWPQPAAFIHSTPSSYVHNDKDQVETDAQSALCTGREQLQSLQQKFASDWTALLGLPHTNATGEG
ncbi:hypothetical protein [Sinomonas gamaensis]|uniref:hypothetical protein n=1 Tax=Sinomonas gamaensis TaxID=2565624 RepID=UPI001BB0DD5F|nr:hypothetical protein [Sinomonas gamaensis]